MMVSPVQGIADPPSGIAVMGATAGPLRRGQGEPGPVFPSGIAGKRRGKPGTGGGPMAIQWLDDYDTALEQARAQRRLVFLDFHKTPG